PLFIYLFNLLEVITYRNIMANTKNMTNSTFSFGRNDFALMNHEAQVLTPFPENLSKTELYNYSLYTKMKVSISECNDRKLLIIGEIFSAKSPLFSNQDIVDYLSGKDSFNEIIIELHECTGRYILFEITSESIQFVGDSMGQFELYFSKDFAGIASNLSVLSRFIRLEKWEGDAANVYSRIARTTSIQIGM